MRGSSEGGGRGQGEAAAEGEAMGGAEGFGELDKGELQVDHALHTGPPRRGQYYVLGH